ncbi:hypothetical protein [Candidatus Proelusimicrobium excrementi]|uniref:arsenate reductase/protein-tyrosine-phosphatase family protein n=1 Tax=Candidatus Proelusimicrobium excrementi TaxID=3416222 RepID=UPI003CB21E1B|nr:hypothetical protein [Elusimicrobiaceae bacterium]
MNICFICHANICRSFAAERLFNALAEKNGKSNLKAFSRGVYASPAYEIPSKIKKILEDNGASWQGHCSTLLGREDAERADLLLVMTEDQLDLIMDKFPQYADKIFLLLDYAFGLEEDMPDPISKSGRGFEKIMNRLKEAAEAVFKKVSAA